MRRRAWSLAASSREMKGGGGEASGLREGSTASRAAMEAERSTRMMKREEPPRGSSRAGRAKAKRRRQRMRS